MEKYLSGLTIADFELSDASSEDYTGNYDPQGTTLGQDLVRQVENADGVEDTGHAYSHQFVWQMDDPTAAGLDLQYVIPSGTFRELYPDNTLRKLYVNVEDGRGRHAGDAGHLYSFCGQDSSCDLPPVHGTAVPGGDKILGCHGKCHQHDHRPGRRPELCQLHDHGHCIPQEGVCHDPECGHDETAALPDAGVRGTVLRRADPSCLHGQSVRWQ